MTSPTELLEPTDYVGRHRDPAGLRVPTKPFRRNVYVGRHRAPETPETPEKT